MHMALREDVHALASIPAERKAHPRKPIRAEDGVTALGVISPPPIHVQTPTFDGSLGQLFLCVRERKIDLLDIPLLPICEAYFEYLLNSSLSDLDHAAAALTALSYLLERKAWALLPIADPEPEVEEVLELIAPTVGQYETAIQALSIYRQERERYFFRATESPGDFELPFTIGEVTLADLARAFERVLAKATVEPVRITKVRRSLSEQMKIVYRSLTEEWRALDQMIELPFSREEAVYWFLSLLELIRLGQAGVKLVENEVRFARLAKPEGSKGA